MQAEVFALAGEIDGLKEANGYLTSENKKLIDRASNCAEEVIRWKGEAKEATEEMEAAEDREKDKVKIINGLKKKVTEPNEEIEVLIFEKKELSKQVKEKDKELQEEERGRNCSEEKGGKSKSARELIPAPPFTAAPHQEAAATAATAGDTTTTTTTTTPQEEQPEEKKIEEEEEELAPKSGEGEEENKKDKEKEEEGEDESSEKGGKERKERKQERKDGTQESSKKKVTIFVSSQMLATFGATTRTWAYTSLFGLIRKVARTYETIVKGALAWRKIVDHFKQIGCWEIESEIDNYANSCSGGKNVSGESDCSGGKNSYNKNNVGKNSDQWQQWWEAQWGAPSSGDCWWQPDPWAPQQGWGAGQGWGKGWK